MPVNARNTNATTLMQFILALSLIFQKYNSKAVGVFYINLSTVDSLST